MYSLGGEKSVLLYTHSTLRDDLTIDNGDRSSVISVIVSLENLDCRTKVWERWVNIERFDSIREIRIVR